MEQFPVKIFFLLFFTRIVYADPFYTICIPDRNFSSGSPYEMNLSNLLVSMSFKTPAKGFYNYSVGEFTNTVYGLAQCLTDVSVVNCGKCIHQALSEYSLAICKLAEEAIILYDDCAVSYSPDNFFGTASLNNGAFICPNNFTDIYTLTSYNQEIKKLLSNLTKTAANDKTGLMYAKAYVSGHFSPNISGIMQCTRDLNVTECVHCLDWLVSAHDRFCRGKVAAKFYSRNCYLRYQPANMLEDHGSEITTPTPASTPPPALSSPPKAPIRSPVPL